MSKTVPKEYLPYKDDKIMLQEYLIGTRPGLKKSDYDLGTSGPDRNGVDGIVGTKTKNGVREFQKAFGGLGVDGIYGPNTAAAFDSELNSACTDHSVPATVKTPLSVPPELYDLMWVNKLPGGQRASKVALTKPNTLGKPTKVASALIIYPALLAPAIVVGKDETIEVVLAFSKADLSFILPPDQESASTEEKESAVKYAINQQLKIHKGLNVKKEYNPVPLFEGASWKEHISLEEVDDLNSRRVETKSKAFSGILHPIAAELYGKKGKYKTNAYFKVSLHPSVLESASSAGAKYQRNKTAEGRLSVNPEKDTNQDHIINKSSSIKSTVELEGRYGFEVKGNDVVAGSIDLGNPIQTYHPVFAYDKLSYANVAHMADLHVNSRQQILSRSKARVAEHDDIDSVGEMMNICSMDTRELLQKFGKDKEVDVVVIGGDIVDFMNNVVTDSLSPLKVTEIWGLVEIGEKVTSNKEYKDYVDFIAFYSLVVEFYQACPKPTFVITGNHDCYYEPYGISPRIPLGPLGQKRANEGIPWDHNLTMYEAILSFGPTYAKLLTGLNVSGRPPSSFWKEKLSWFYTVLTPFSDFAIRLPKQHIVGLGWGSNEDMLSPSRLDGQGIGHLPRADEAMDDKQYKFLKDVALDQNDGRKIILTTHFTFVSYAESISNKKAMSPEWGVSRDQGDVYYTKSWYSTRDFSKADMGTFEKHREEIYADVLAAKNDGVRQCKIQLILTGHSHRRGFYTIRKIEDSGNNSVKTGFHDFPVFKNGKPDYVVDHRGKRHRFKAEDQNEPWVVLSDSGGSVPRLNLAGEFKGWGSDVPAGTKIVFDDGQNGAVSSIETIRVTNKRAKPRLAVALDYMDIMAEKVIKSFKGQYFLAAADRKRDWQYVFNLELAKCFTDKYADEVYGLKIESICFYFMGKENVWCEEKWQETQKAIRIPLVRLKNIDGTGWAFPTSFNKVFRTRVSKGKKRGVFLAIKLKSSSPHMKRYNFTSPWTFELKIKHSTSGGWIRDKKERYELVRHNDWKEIPDLDRRENYAGY